MAAVRIFAAGKVTTDLRFTQSAKGPDNDFLSFAMAHNSGRYQDDGTWVQTSTLWLNVKAFGRLARNARGAVAKGRPVVVHGELRHEPYIGADGQKRNSLELHADAIGLNLRHCTAEYMGFGERTREALVAAPQVTQPDGAGDPFGAPPDTVGDAAQPDGAGKPPAAVGADEPPF
ncbi:single-stranded DNA-binding protein [Tsukamurella soli]|uniref:Single-stranded DNA-binding protein n=1 Tax=Tsukamurella soli TaxID=644556 RepID=A0ABP8JZQ8_9ACTN